MNAIRRYVGPIVHIERSQIAIATGLRKGLGAMAPLAAGVAAHHPLVGVVIAGSAISAGFTDLGGAYRSRAYTMTLASIGMAISTFAGTATAAFAWPIVVLMGIWGFGAGLLTAIGPAATTIGLQSTVALAIASAFPLHPALAIMQAGYVLIGGGIQLLLAIAPWPLQGFGPQRAALAAAYRRLAAFAESRSSRETGPRAADALADASTIIAAGVPRFGSGAEGETLQSLLAEGFRIQLELSTLAEIRERLTATATVPTRVIAHLDDLTAASAYALRAVADSLEARHVPFDLTALQRQLDAAAKALRQTAQEDYPQAGAPERAALVAAAPHAAALGGQLRAAARLATAGARGETDTVTPATVRRPPALQLHSAWPILRANLTLRSTIFRHAIRLGITLAIAATLARFFSLQHGYWVPLTALLVLKPDFSTTFVRGFARGLGTGLGAALATLLVAAFAPSQIALTVLAVVLACGAYAIFAANYVLFSMLVTALVVVLVSFAGTPPFTASVDRIIDTVIGVALAMGAYAVWPSWERPQVPGNLAAMLNAYRHYFGTVMAGYTDPAADLAEIGRRRAAARLARSNAEASVQRAQNEPACYRPDPHLTLGLLSSGHRFIQSVLSLEAHLRSAPPRTGLPELAPFADAVDQALHALAAAVEHETRPPSLPPLREHYDRLAAHLEALAQRADRHAADLAFIVSEADRIVDSVNTMGHALSGDHPAHHQNRRDAAGHRFGG